MNETLGDLEGKTAIGTCRCPVCQGVRVGPPLYRYNAEQAAAHFCPAVRDPDRHARLVECIRQLWNGSECLILRCAECGFAFGYPFKGGNELFYDILHEQKGYPSWRWDYTIASEMVLSRYAGGRILEIGAGEGRFLDHLEAGWERYAIEAGQANERELRARGIHTCRNLDEAATMVPARFQVVAMFQVLEHLADFRHVLEQCRRVIAADGTLIVTVPDGDAMIRQERITGCPDMPPNHIGKWTPRSLQLAVTAAGFTCGAPIHEPPSWRKFFGNIQLRIVADASRSGSLTSQIYRVQARRLRIPLLAGIAALPALIRLLPHVRWLRKGGAFAVTASPA